MKYKLIIDKNATEEVVVTVHAPSYLTKQIEDLVRGYCGNDGIMGCRSDKMRKLEPQNIQCITVIDRKVIAIDENGEQYRIQDTLRELEISLPSYFIRINKSAIANEHCISHFDVAFNGGIDAVFKCGWREYVSRRCFSQIKRRYEGV